MMRFSQSCSTLSFSSEPWKQHWLRIMQALLFITQQFTPWEELFWDQGKSRCNPVSTWSSVPKPRIKMDQLEPPHSNQTPGLIMWAYGLCALLTHSLRLWRGGRRDVAKFRVGSDHMQLVLGTGKSAAGICIFTTYLMIITFAFSLYNIVKRLHLLKFLLSFVSSFFGIKWKDVASFLGFDMPYETMHTILSQ